MNSFPDRLLVIFCLALALAGAPTAALSKSKDPAKSCSLFAYEHLADADLSQFKAVEVEVSGVSIEGGIAIVYSDGKNIVAIKATFYSETSQSQDSYFFPLGNLETYLVNILQLDYALPYSQGSLEVISSTITKFVVCDGQLPNYPNVSNYVDVFSVSKAILSKILERNQQP